MGFTGQIAGVARDEENQRRMEELGVDRVIMPFPDAADFAANFLMTELMKRDAR